MIGVWDRYGIKAQQLGHIGKLEILLVGTGKTFHTVQQIWVGGQDTFYNTQVEQHKKL